MHFLSLSVICKILLNMTPESTVFVNITIICELYCSPSLDLCVQSFAIYCYHSLFLHVNDTAQNCKIFIFFNEAFHSYPSKTVSILFCMTVLIANITFQSYGNEITYVNYKIADVKFLRIMDCFSLPLFKSSSLSLSSYSSVS